MTYDDTLDIIQEALSEPSGFVMAPNSEGVLFEMRLAHLGVEIDALVEQAESNPAVIAQQDARTQLMLSYLQHWRVQQRAMA